METNMTKSSGLESKQQGIYLVSHVKNEGG